MKTLIYGIICFLLLSSTVYAGGFDDFLKEVLVETGTQSTRSNEYVFAPGDPVIQKETYSVYYAGSEIISNTRVLLLSLVIDKGVMLLRYPNPDIIRVRDFRLQILSFDNNSLRLKMLER